MNNSYLIDRNQATKHLDYLGYKPGDNVYLRFCLKSQWLLIEIYPQSSFQPKLIRTLVDPPIAH